MARFLVLDEGPDASEAVAPTEVPAPDKPREPATQILPVAKSAPPEEPEPGERTTHVGMPPVAETPVPAETPAPTEEPEPGERTWRRT